MKTCLQNLRVGDIISLRTGDKYEVLLVHNDEPYTVVNIASQRRLTTDIRAIDRSGAIKIIKAK